MTKRWLLPDGIGDVLPEEARQIEKVRRDILDLYDSWGYQLIIPPLLEFTESLLIGTNPDLDLQTFKVTDQLSGRTLGVRADITPQAARIDAHSLKGKGPVRLCYAGSVLHTRPATALASRSPIQVGAEYFGGDGTEADIEVISLMLETLQRVQPGKIVLSLGHVGIFKSLVNAAGLEAASQEQLLDIMQRKALAELKEFLQQQAIDPKVGALLEQVSGMNGNQEILSLARERLTNAPKQLSLAIDELELVANSLLQRYPDIELFFDLAELPGYHYHSGLVFAAYIDGFGSAVANGGRYDNIGEVFGNARPATGFNADLKTLIQLGESPSNKPDGILVEEDGTKAQWQAIQALREQGEQVICIKAGSAFDTSIIACTRQLVQDKNIWIVKPKQA